MPYGLPAEQDTPANNRKMERCVQDVMDGQPKLSKGSAIAICKQSLGFVKKALSVITVRPCTC